MILFDSKSTSIKWFSLLCKYRSSRAETSKLDGGTKQEQWFGGAYFHLISAENFSCPVERQKDVLKENKYITKLVSAHRQMTFFGFGFCKIDERRRDRGEWITSEKFLFWCLSGYFEPNTENSEKRLNSRGSGRKSSIDWTWGIALSTHRRPKPWLKIIILRTS